MKATSFAQTNLNLGAGNNPNTNDLPIAYSQPVTGEVHVKREFPAAVSKDTDPVMKDVLFIISKWKLSDEELAILNERKEIWLGVMAPLERPTQPPVLLTVQNPFTELGFEAFPAEDFIPPFENT
jgi:hypothetical protein